MSEEKKEQTHAEWIENRLKDLKATSLEIRNKTSQITSSLVDVDEIEKEKQPDSQPTTFVLRIKDDISCISDILQDILSKLNTFI